MEGTPLRLLIVDDDEVVREVLKLKLESSFPKTKTTKT